MKILRDVLEAQKLIQEEQPDVQLITYQELVAIQVQWHRDFIFDQSVSDVFKEIFDEGAGIETDEKNELESELLRDIFKDSPEQGLLVHNA